MAQHVRASTQPVVGESEEQWLQRLSGRLIDHGYGLLDVSLASYNQFIRIELPRLVNEMRSIMWSERTPNGSAMSMVIQIRFASVQRPMLTESQPQILLPLQAQQLCKSYNGRLLVNVQITLRVTTPAAEPEGAPVVAVHEADVQDLCIGEIPVLVGSCLCHQPLAPGTSQPGAISYFIVNGRPGCHIFFCVTLGTIEGHRVTGTPRPGIDIMWIAACLRLVTNHPLVSSCVLQSKAIQYTAEVRSIPASNTNRLPVVFALRVTVNQVPSLLPAEPVLGDPLIVTLTYFRQEVPVLLLFYAYGVMDRDTICTMIRRTAGWADVPTLRRLLYATQQHTAAVRDRSEAMAVLVRYVSSGAPTRLGQPEPSPAAVEDLLI